MLGLNVSHSVSYCPPIYAGHYFVNGAVDEVVEIKPESDLSAEDKY